MDNYTDYGQRNNNMNRPSDNGFKEYGTNYDDYNNGGYDQYNQYSGGYAAAFDAQAGLMSDRSFYSAIYAFLLWGFGMNWVLCTFFAPLIMGIDFRVLLIGYVVLCFAGIFVSKSQNIAIAFIGYNMIVLPIGALLSVVVAGYNPLVVQYALIGTAAISVGMMIVGFIMPQVFYSLGKTLCASLLIVIIVELIMTLLGFSTGVIDYIVVGIFALYIGYDMSKASVAQRDLRGALGVAIELYLDIINIFIRLLRILGKSRN